MVRFAKLPLQFDVTAMQAEIQSAAKEWLPHFNTVYYDGNWNVLALRSPGGNHVNIIPEARGGDDYEDTIYMDHFDSVKKLVATLQCPVLSVRFLNLHAGAVIKQHTDAELAFEKGEARLHFPVVTHPGVEFYCEQERVFLNEGECWYLNANLPHRVSNNSPTNRIHLVIDCKVNDWLKDLINSSDHVAHKKDMDDATMTLMIKQLRLQNTPKSNQMADEFEKQLNG